MSNRRLALLEFDMGWSMWLTEAHLPFHVGRHTSNDLQNSSDSISRKHCLFDVFDDQLYIIDAGSLNGTVLHNRVIKNSKTPLIERTCLLLSDMMMWVTPCDKQGKIIKPDAAAVELDTASGILHGVCLVDICSSMDMGLDQTGHVLRMLRSVIMEHDHDKLLLLKSLGDGYLAVFDPYLPMFSAAKRLLDWQNSKGNIFSASIRVTLDAGITHHSHGHDRAGLPICRVTRLDKTQVNNIDVPSEHVEDLKSQNRCLITKSVSQLLDGADEETDCTFMGELKLKGFADELCSIYQYNI